MDKKSSRVLIADDNDFRRERLGKDLRGVGLNPKMVGLGPGGQKAVGAVLMLNPAIAIFNLHFLPHYSFVHSHLNIQT